MEFITAAAVVVALCVIYFSYVYGPEFVRFVSLTRKIPGPTFYELYTHHAKYLHGKKRLPYLAKLCESYNHKPWGIWINTNFVVFLSDADSMSEVAKSKNLCNKPVMFYDDMSRYVGRGLMTNKIEENKRHRKIINPAFRKTLMESIQLPQMNKQAKKLVEIFREKSNCNNVEWYAAVLGTIVEQSFWSLTSGMFLYPDNQHYYKTTVSVMDNIQVHTISPVYYWLVHKWKKSSQQTEDAAMKMLAESEKGIMEVKKTIQQKLSGDFQPTNPFEFMVQAETSGEGGFTAEDTSAEYRSLVWAAFDTTSYTLAMCMLMLALHQDAQQRVAEELDAVFGGSDRPVESGDFSKLVYLEAIVKETLRIFPPVPLVSKAVDDDTVICGVTIPKGCIVMLNVYALHRNKQVFKDPLKFDPERFLPENAEGRNTYAHLPFSVGSRNCPGQQYAIMSLKAMLSHVLRHLQILPGDGFTSMEDIKIKVSVTMHLRESLPLRFISRNR